jgi:hypothetical protein
VVTKTSAACASGHYENLKYAAAMTEGYLFILVHPSEAVLMGM